MRSATHGTGWVQDETEQVVGLSLGYDFCAEHEWGVPRLATAFRINQEKPGFSGLEAHAHHSQVIFLTHQGRLSSKYKPRRNGRSLTELQTDKDKFHEAVLLVSSHSYSNLPEKPTYKDVAKEAGFWIDLTDKFYSKYRDDKHDIATSWDEGEFCVRVRGSQNIQHLKDLYEAILRDDVVLNAPEGNSFARHGWLAVGIASRFNQDFKDNLLTAWKENKRLEEAFDKTGIKERLKAAGKKYFALAPAWADKEHTKLKAWLNPYDQKNNDSRWCSIQDLDNWIAGTGPVPISQDLRKAFEDVFGHHVSSNFGKAPDGRFILASGNCYPAWADDEHTKLSIIVEPNPSGVVYTEGPNEVYLKPVRTSQRIRRIFRPRSSVLS